MYWIIFYKKRKYKRDINISCFKIQRKLFQDLWNYSKKRNCFNWRIEKVVRKIETQEIKAITIVDDEYPKAFKRCEYSLIVLFYKDNINLLNKK